MSYALVFSGQGMQHPAMLSWLGSDTLLQEMEGELGADWRERLADPDLAGRNAHAQLLLTTLALTAWTELAPHLPPPSAIAGYSVGELAAFAAAGVVDPSTAIELARQRAALMDRDAEGCASGLLALSGLDPEALERICSDFGLMVAIRNDPTSVIVGGLRAQLAPAAEAAQRLGGNSTLLNVALASHTHWMREAAKDFEARLETLPFARPAVPLFSNFGGRVRDAAHARQALARQIDHCARWDECMEGVASRRVDCVLEIGPGQALARMWNQRFPEIPARSADEFRSLAGVVGWVSRRRG